MRVTTIFTLIFGVLLTACQSTTSTQAEKTTINQPAPSEADIPGTSYGAAITADNAIPYSDLWKQIQSESLDSVQTKVIGTVTEVCQMKGCWMNIQAETESSEPLFVQFKDYGFFMPKDIAGRQVIMEGIAYKATTSVDELRHYAEDAGKSATEIAAITEPETQLKFLASGVILLEE